MAFSDFVFLFHFFHFIFILFLIPPPPVFFESKNDTKRTKSVFDTTKKILCDIGPMGLQSWVSHVTFCNFCTISSGLSASTGLEHNGPCSGSCWWRIRLTTRGPGQPYYGTTRMEQWPRGRMKKDTQAISRSWRREYPGSNQCLQYFYSSFFNGLGDVGVFFFSNRGQALKDSVAGINPGSRGVCPGGCY